MRVLYAHLYDCRYGIAGAEKVLWDVSMGMKENFGVKVACAVNAGELLEKFQKIDAPTVALEGSKLKMLSTCKRLDAIIAEFKPDIVHSHHRYVTFLLDTFFKRKAIILHTEHVLRCDKRWLFRYGHFATAVHETVQKNLIDHYKLSADSVVAIPNAIAGLNPQSDRVRSLRAQHSGPQGTSHVLCIGRLEVQKGHKYLIEAVHMMPARLRERLRIFFAGQGSLESALKKEINEKGLQKNFVFLGYCREIPEHLSFCDFSILPSLWEGMPLSILEAYSVGRTVIATNIAGSRELIVNGKTGLLVPSRDSQALAKAIEELIVDPYRAQKMGQAAQIFWREHFSFSKVLEQYHQCYEMLIKLHGQH